MEEELASLRIALEQLQDKHERSVHSIQQRFNRNERELEQEIKVQRQQIDQLKSEILYHDTLREQTASLYASLQVHLDRLGAEQSLLWDSVGRMMRDYTTKTDQQQHRKLPVLQNKSMHYINKKQLNYENERMMQIVKTKMADMASFFSANFDDLRTMIVQMRTDTRQLIESSVKKGYSQTKRQIETLVSQVNANTRAIGDVKEDQEVSTMALIDTMSCMKTKIDAALEEWQLYGGLCTNSILADASTTTSTVITGMKHEKAFGNQDKDFKVLQLLERKSAQWNAQCKSMRTEIRSLKRQCIDQRQDVEELQQLVESSVNILSQQAETTASLCEKQLQRFNDLVRKEYVSETEFRALKNEVLQTDTIWRERFNELLQVLEYNQCSSDVVLSPQQAKDTTSPHVPAMKEDPLPGTPITSASNKQHVDSSMTNQECVETAADTPSTSNKKNQHLCPVHVHSNDHCGFVASSIVQDNNIIDLTAVITEERDDVDPVFGVNVLILADER